MQVLCYEAPECILELAELGCDFDRNEDGTLHLAREGGQSVARSIHREDATGAAIMLKGMTVEYLLNRTYAVMRGDAVLFWAAAGGVGGSRSGWM